LPPALKDSNNTSHHTLSQLQQMGSQLQPIQYDYLKRLIKNLEDEALAGHRIAKERRELNAKYDVKAEEERERIK